MYEEWVGTVSAAALAASAGLTVVDLCWWLFFWSLCVSVAEPAVASGVSCGVLVSIRQCI